MAIEVKWTDQDPLTGERRYLCAERFARVWSFKYRNHRRADWNLGLTPTREIWEHLLESLRRRYRRREGVSDEDIAEVEKILRSLPVPRDLDQGPDK
ncbi:MAG: hypothetical protein ACKO23_04010 [Gemmataceae bacterium]